MFRINAKEAALSSAETPFSYATREPGIECIRSNVTQAEERVERVNQPLQDRLIEQMHLAYNPYLKAKR